MPITSASIANYLEEISWTYRILDENTVLTGVKCPVPFYDYPAVLEIKITQHWIYVRAMLQRDVNPAQTAAVLRLISKWNQRSYRVKFLLVSGCVVVQSEIPVVQCHFGAFFEALEAVCRYTAQAGVEIAILATDPWVSGIYERLEAVRDESTASNLGVSLTASDLMLDFDISVNTIPG